jgi:transcriptional regulator with XRE-family HTH domain
MDDSLDSARDEELRRAFSLRVDRLRAAKGLSRKQLALRVGSRTAFSRWSKGRAWPRAETLYRLSDELGVTVDFLMFGRSPMRASVASDPGLQQLKEAIEETPQGLRKALAEALAGALLRQTEPRPGGGA